MGLFEQLSVVVPVDNPANVNWEFLDDFAPVKENFEIVLVSSDTPRGPLKEKLSQLGQTCSVRWVRETGVRAKKVNTGVREAQKGFVWVLPPEVRIPHTAFSTLESSVGQYPQGLHYFPLKTSGSSKLNLWKRLWLWYRTEWLRVPVVQQGLCLRRHSFFDLGGFREDLTEYEEQFFVLKAKRKHVPIRPANYHLIWNGKGLDVGGLARTWFRHLSFRIRLFWTVVSQNLDAFRSKISSVLESVKDRYWQP